MRIFLDANILVSVLNKEQPQFVWPLIFTLQKKIRYPTGKAKN